MPTEYASHSASVMNATLERCFGIVVDSYKKGSAHGQTTALLQ